MAGLVGTMRQSKRAELSPAGAIREKFEKAVSGDILQLTRAVAARMEAWMRVEGAAEFRRWKWKWQR